MGRHSDPQGVQDAKGNPRKQRRVVEAPEEESAPAHKVAAPRKLGRDPQRVWDKLARELVRTNVIRTTDHEALARYCLLLDEWWKHTRRLKKEGVVYVSNSRHGKMKRQNPLFPITMRLDQWLESYEINFGLTPSARQRIMLGLAAAQPSIGKPGELFEKDGAAPPPPAPDNDSPIGLLNASDRVH